MKHQRLEAATTSPQPALSTAPTETQEGQWTQAEAIALCRRIEAVCPAFGCHVALTGGTLYKDGPRKDCDLLFYRIRQEPEIDIEGLFAALAAIGLERTRGFGWCIKATLEGRSIDCFFPENHGDEYEPLDASEAAFLDGLLIAKEMRR